MATYTDITATAQQLQFQRRVAYALTIAAIAAYNEDPATTGHAARAAYATRVLSGSFNINGVVLGVLANSTIAAEESSTVIPGNSVPDTDIQFAVNSIFGALAGA